MGNLLDIARRVLASRAGGKGEKGQKSSESQPFTPFSPFPPERAGAECLSGLEPWDLWAAIRLMEAADDLVEQSGIDGRLPPVRDAAAMVASAYAARDMETVRFAVAEFAAVVRGIASANGVRRLVGG